MFQKQGKFYADWRDKSGKRLRKSFTSKAAALQFEAEQKDLAHPTTQARGQRSPKCSAPTSTGTTTETAAKSRAPKRSSLSLVVSRPRSSGPRTSPKRSRV